MSVPTNWDLAGQGIQDEIDALSPLAQSSATSLPAVNASSIDGKVIRLSLMAIAGSGSWNLKVNGTSFLSNSVTTGVSFCVSVELAWDSSNQTLVHNSGLPGGFSDLYVGNPSTFTFSTDAAHTVKSFTLSVV